MELSFSEIVVLAAARKGALSKRQLAMAAVYVYASKRYGHTVALTDIDYLMERGFLAKHRYEDLVEITRSGSETLEECLPVLGEVLRIANSTRY